jgi:hypothetical protein
MLEVLSLNHLVGQLQGPGERRSPPGGQLLQALLRLLDAVGKGQRQVRLFPPEDHQPQSLLFLAGVQEKGEGCLWFTPGAN